MIIKMGKKLAKQTEKTNQILCLKKKNHHKKTTIKNNNNTESKKNNDCDKGNHYLYVYLDSRSMEK